MLNAFEDDTVAVYCDAVHSHRGWAHLDTSISLRSIDCGCVMVRREEALTIGWTSTEFAADWVYIDVPCFGVRPRPLSKSTATALRPQLTEPISLAAHTQRQFQELPLTRCPRRLPLHGSVLGRYHLHLDRVAIKVVLCHHCGRRTERSNRAFFEHQ